MLARGHGGNAVDFSVTCDNGRTSGRQMIVTDNETKVELLNNEAIAKSIIKLLCDRPDQPVTVGVHGDWGAGKSSVLEMTEAGFEGEGKVLCLKFNGRPGWRGPAPRGRDR